MCGLDKTLISQKKPDDDFYWGEGCAIVPLKLATIRREIMQERICKAMLNFYGHDGVLVRSTVKDRLLQRGMARYSTDLLFWLDLQIQEGILVR